MSTFDAGALHAKAAVYIDRALEATRESTEFAFWCHMAVELLVRASVASRSPLLLVAGRGATAAGQASALAGQAAPSGAQSAPISQVLQVAELVLPSFDKDVCAAALKLNHTRNAELHTGEAALEARPASSWYTDFARVCVAAAQALGVPLSELLGPEEAEIAESEIVDEDRAVAEAVRGLITAAQKLLQRLDLDERGRGRRRDAARADGAGAFAGRTPCPACKTVVARRGQTAQRHATRLDPLSEELYEPTLVVPTGLRCGVCELQLDGRAAMRAAGVGDPFTVNTWVDPLDYHRIDIADAAQQAGLYVVDPSDGPEYQDE